MLEKIDKIAPYVALVLLAYLCHSATSSGAAPGGKSKPPPTITHQMLRPELIVPEPHASSVKRDPFEVRWDSYLAEAQLKASLLAKSLAEEEPGPDYEYALEDGELPPLPSGLKGLLLGDKTQYVVVGDRVCKPGDLVSGDNPRRSWVVERVEVDGVVLRFNDVRRKIELTTTESVPQAMPTPQTTSAPAEDWEQ